MKRLILLPLLFVSCLALGQSVKMSVNMSGMDLGTATMTIRQASDGGLLGTMDMKFDAAGQTGSGKMRFAYTKTGRTKYMEDSLKLGSVSQSSKHTYTATHLIIDKVEAGKKTTKKVSLPKGKNLDDPSNFWFIRTKPKVGTTIKTWSYDADAGKFLQKTTKYVGPKTITVSGKSVKAHHIEHEDGSVWVDEKGMPLRMVMMEDGMEMVFERLWK